MAITGSTSTFENFTSASRRRSQPGTRLAAIDVGSNAIRLVIGEVGKNGEIKVLKKFREGVRLGKDTFSDGTISKKSIERTVETFIKFRRFIKEHDARQVRAVGTSALREARNRDTLISEVLKISGLQLQVIDGFEEGQL